MSNLRVIGRYIPIGYSCSEYDRDCYFLGCLNMEYDEAPEYFCNLHRKRIKNYLHCYNEIKGHDNKLKNYVSKIKLVKIKECDW